MLMTASAGVDEEQQDLSFIAGEDEERQDLSFIAGENSTWHSHFGRQFGGFVQN